MKSIAEYMNDPRMAEIADEPLPVREVHAWRLMVQDDKQGMSEEEREDYYAASMERADAFCAKHGIHLNYAANPKAVVQT